MFAGSLCVSHVLGFAHFRVAGNKEYYVFVSPFIIAFLVVVGWNDFACTYSCLLVGLIYVLISRMFSVLKRSPLYSVMSKKVSSFKRIYTSCSIVQLRMSLLSSSLFDS